MGHKISMESGAVRQWAGHQPSSEPMRPLSQSPLRRDAEGDPSSRTFPVSRSLPPDVVYEAVKAGVAGVVDNRPPASVEALSDPARAPQVESDPITGEHIIPRVRTIPMGMGESATLIGLEDFEDPIAGLAGLATYGAAAHASQIGGEVIVHYSL